MDGHRLPHKKGSQKKGAVFHFHLIYNFRVLSDFNQPFTVFLDDSQTLRVLELGGFSHFMLRRIIVI